MPNSFGSLRKFFDTEDERRKVFVLPQAEANMLTAAQYNFLKFFKTFLYHFVYLLMFVAKAT